MLPFDISAALQGHPVVTRNGSLVTKIIFYDNLDDDQECISGVVKGTLRLWYKNGSYLRGTNSDGDLFLQDLVVQKHGFVTISKSLIETGISSCGFLMTQTSPTVDTDEDEIIEIFWSEKQ